MRVYLGTLPVTHVHAQPALRIEDERACRMVHRVAAWRRPRLFLIQDLELFGDLRGRGRITIETNERRIERRHVARQELLGVTLGIDGDEQHLHMIRVGPEFLHRRRELRKRGRAKVRTLRIAEEHHYYLAAEVRQGPRLAGVVDQLEVAANGDTGNVGTLKLRGR